MSAYAARICWNSKGWIVPSGDAQKLETGKTYVQDTAFGHEEWIFNFQWVLDGWKYSFLQPVNRSWEKVVGQTLDLLLYAIGPRGAWYYVGEIQPCEVITRSQADKARESFEKRGWLQQMRDQVAVLGGDVAAIDAGMLFNVRFKPTDAEILNPKVTVGAKDAIRRLRRYTLVSLDGANATVRTQWPHRIGTTTLGKTGVVAKAATPAGTMDLAHVALQHELYRVLAARYGAKNVVKEENFVDLKVKLSGEVTLIEVKTDARPMHAIREALGQLLEYAFGCEASGEKVREIVVAAPGELSTLDRSYVEHLRVARGLTLKYVCFRQGMKNVDIG